MLRKILAAVAVIPVSMVPSVLLGQSFDACTPCYTLVPTQVMEPQTVTTYRLEYEDRFEERQIVSYKPIVQERVEKRQYTVRKPVIETSTVNETYTVLKPVYKTSYVDQSYTQTEYVTETSQREETVTSYRPVIETQFQTQHVIVQRPVTETQLQTQSYTTYQPVTTMQTAVVDQGGFVANQYYRPGDTRYHLRWMSGGQYIDPMTGLAGYRRGGLGWVPYTSQGQIQTQVAYRPNYQQVQIPQTSYMPQIVQQQVPVQVTRMENQVIEQQIPIQVQKMQAFEEKRVVPITVQKPVTRVITNKVPVQSVEWVQEQHVRPVTMQRESYKLETYTEDVPIRTYTTERVVETVRVPVRTVRRVPVQEVRMVPKTVYSHMPIISSGGYSSPVVDPYASGSSSSVVPSTSMLGAPSVSQQGTSNDSQKIDASKPVVESKDEKLPNGEKLSPENPADSKGDSTGSSSLQLGPESTDSGTSEESGTGLRSSTLPTNPRT